MRFTTTIPARIWDWLRTRRYDALSNDAEISSQRQFCADCIITTLGYDFQEGQDFAAVLRVLESRVSGKGWDDGSTARERQHGPSQPFRLCWKSHLRRMWSTISPRPDFNCGE